MTTGEIDVDVLMPVYNAEQTVEEAISSILHQTLTSIRLFIVDDGSSDNTPNILDKLKERDSRIEIIRQENRGIVDSLNFSLPRCTARYLARFDADDVAYPDRLRTQVAYLDEHEDCVAVAGRVDHIDVKGNSLNGLHQPGPPEMADMTWVPAIEPYLIHPYLMVRRSTLETVGGYRYVYNAEDSDLYWRLSECGKLHNLDVVLGKYRVHSASISSSNIINSRIMAVSSQLAAISAQRRRSGHEDLIFDKRMHQAYKKTSTLEEMWLIASNGLSVREANHLRIAASIKLLELSAYRPIDLQVSDCRFIRGSLYSDTDLTAENKKEIDWYVTTTAARLFRQGRYQEMAGILPITSAHVALARLIRGR